MCKQTRDDLVRFSRAGDAFHYRWVALRCLKMIHPLSKVNMIMVEGSKEHKAAGEYIVDVSEYVDGEEEEIHYYQLKHTTVRKDSPFTMTSLEDSIKGFAARYLEHRKRKNYKRVYFYIITNRMISPILKKNFIKTIQGKKCSHTFTNLIKSYTNLEGRILKDFCSRFRLLDGYGDYQEQWNNIYFEMANLVAGQIEQSHIDSLVSMISDRVLPNSDGKIVKEDVLKRLNYSSINELFPAPCEVEKIDNIILRKQYIELVDSIQKSDENVIIHASGGVGKSAFARSVEKIVGNGNVVIIYDCFGLGTYRNRSKIRHSYKIALTQIANELAIKGLCDPMLVSPTAKENEIINLFLKRIASATEKIKNNRLDGQLYILIDAADNAEMAAQDFKDNCFVHELLREKMPDSCHLVMLCRSERIDILKPPSNINQYELLPFLEEETIEFLQSNINDIYQHECLEIHRLTDGNPRVQSNAISFSKGKKKNISKFLGPQGTTLDEQIEYQLEMVIDRIKDKLTEDYKKQIENICCGLATLPPFIHISVLASLSDVEESVIKSFIADLGRPIWVLDDVVQFRDEPTESWFRKTYIGTKEQIIAFINRIKNLANKYVYVAEVLPSLYLKAGMYQELIKIALSDEYLPEENPIDKRNVRMFRIRFAFKAALRLKQHTDAIKLAFMAGEEKAGNQRQIELFKNNVDLIPLVQDKEKVQEIAFKRILAGEWRGSENIYTASLLSSILECRGESLTYLRAAESWMHIYLEEYKQTKENRVSFKLENKEIVEVAFSIYNLYGLKEVVKYMSGWSPEIVIYNNFKLFTHTMIDLGRLKEVDELSMFASTNIYALMGINYELVKIGKFINKISLDKILTSNEFPQISDILTNNSYSDTRMGAVISLIEASIFYEFDINKIKKFVDQYLPKVARYGFEDRFSFDFRSEFLRSRAIMKYLGMIEDEKSWIPEDKRKDEQSYISVYNLLFPWYDFRFRCALQIENQIQEKFEELEISTKKILTTTLYSKERLVYEIIEIQSSILMVCSNLQSEKIQSIYNKIIYDSQYFRINDQLNFLRGAKRNSHLDKISDDLEYRTYERIKEYETKAESVTDEYVMLSRAVVNTSINDAVAYFNMAIETVSLFGDELPDRWKAITEVGEKCSREYTRERELANRFIRCAEMVGENIVAEKYWDREQAIKICTQLSPADGLAAISRWRESDIGYIDQLFPTVIKVILMDGYISPRSLWALSAFISNYRILSFAKLCSDVESDESVSKKILNKGNFYYDILENCRESDEASKIYSNTYTYDKEWITEDEIDKLYIDVDFFTMDGIKTVWERFKASKNHYSNTEKFWKSFYDRVPSGKYVDFLLVLIKLRDFSFYSLREALSYIPEHWMKKPSVKQQWKRIISIIAYENAHNLLNEFNRSEVIKSLVFEEDEERIIYDNIIKGLSEIEVIESQYDYFEYITLASGFITCEEAKIILDFAMHRFEMHIPEEFGEKVYTSNNNQYPMAKKQLVGFIWSALGSPNSETRWQAVHAVKRLAEFNCKEEIELLVNNTEIECVNEFTHKDYIHYELHSHLYLLIALQRVAKENSKILVDCKDIFLYYANKFMPHALIQKYAVEIMLSIEKSKSKTYSEKELKTVINNIETTFELSERDDIVLIDEDNFIEGHRFYYGYDFERYWFEPLGQVFGVSEKYIQGRANKILKEVLKNDFNESNIKDPRHELWENNMYYTRLAHSHGSYPRVETYDFYLAFHAMLIVAAELLQEMPIVKSFRYEVSPWNEWLSQHMISRTDGYLLSDKRCTIPKDICQWYENIRDNEWKEMIHENDFVNAISCRNESICLDGYWENRDSTYQESIYISSALVSREAAGALISSLMSYDNQQAYKLPSYEENEWEYDKFPFELKGITKDVCEKIGIDEYDPWCGGIRNEESCLGEKYRNLLLEDDAVYETWGIPYEGKITTEFLNGRRLMISKNQLRNLVIKTGLIVIFEVIISRRVSHSYIRNNDDTYVPPKHCIFVFDEKGEILNEY